MKLKEIKILLLFLLSSCNENNKKEYVDRTNLYKENSIKTANLDTYNIVRKLANDTINNWIVNKLAITRAYRHSDWRLDSLVCFNKQVDKCIMSVYNQESLTTNNALNYFYGVKIKMKWFFFDGPVVYAFSEGYGYPKGTSLPFPKLHEIAMQEIFSGYLKKDEKGQWQINEVFFSDFTSGAYGGREPKTQAQWDSVYLMVVRNNWSVRDTTNYKLNQ